MEGRIGMRRSGTRSSCGSTCSMTRCKISASGGVKKRTGGMIVTRRSTVERVASSQNACWLRMEYFG